jgi:hypothetical protein
MRASTADVYDSRMTAGGGRISSLRQLLILQKHRRNVGSELAREGGGTFNINAD